MATELHPWETLANLRRYLETHGWRYVDSHRNFDLWKLGMRETYLDMPQRQDWSDYRYRAAEVLRELARVEGRSMISIAIEVGGYVLAEASHPSASPRGGGSRT